MASLRLASVTESSTGEQTEAHHLDVPAQLQVDTVDTITLEPLTLLRPVDPADTALVEQVCQVANDIDQHGSSRASD